MAKPCPAVQQKARAKELLPPEAFAFYDSGADNEVTYRRNEESFAKILIVPKLLEGVSNPDVSVRLLGGTTKVGCPVGIAPTALHGWATADAERATAKAAENRDCVYTVSLWSTLSMAQIHQSCNGPKWQNIYPDASRTFRDIKEAERLGATALVLSLDQTALKHRKAFPPAYGNLDIRSPNGVTLPGKPNTTWDLVSDCAKATSLPLVVKGVLSAEDATEAVERGAKGIWVSNHGGRMLDTTPSTIEVLPEIVAAVGNRADVYIDGGVRNGLDVLKCYALGANYVFLGRPVLYALAAEGQAGVDELLKGLTDELRTNMMLTGCKTLQDAKHLKLYRETTLSRL